MEGNVKYLNLLVFLLLLCVAPFLFGEDSLEGSFYFSYGSFSDFADLRADIEYRMDLPLRMEAQIELEVDSYEINPEEVTLRIKAGDHLKFSAGYEQNQLLLGDYMGNFEDIPSYETALEEHYDFQGYVSRGLMVKSWVKEVPLGDSQSFSSWLSISRPYDHFDPQLDLGFYYHFLGEDSYLGFSFLYLPYFADSVYRNYGFRTRDYFVGTLSLGDFRNNLIYSIDVGFGQNKNNPLGLLTLPLDSDKEYFLGGDFVVGYSFSVGEFAYLPSLSYSVVFYDITASEYYKMEWALGSQFFFHDDVRLFGDFVLQRKEEYAALEYNDFEFQWLIGIHVRT